MNSLKLWSALCLLISIQHFNNGYVSSKTCFWHRDTEITAEIFDERFQICCELSGIHNKSRQDSTPIGCCGNKTYDKISEVCCNQKVHNRHIQGGSESGKQRVCCGDKLFIAKRSHHCCGSNYVPSNLRCCGRQTPYNASESRCDYDTVVPRGHGVCDGRPYDKFKYKCCSRSRLHNVSSFDKTFGCCGEKLIDTNTQQCCGWSKMKIIQPLTGQCCGLFDSNKEICCQGNRIVSNGVLRCCGNGSVNISDPKEGCCMAGKVGTSYRKNTEKCCNGSVHFIRNTKNATCCGKQLLSSREQVCCNNRAIINKTAPSHNSCCSERPGRYRSCNRQVPTKRPETCGRVPYNEDRDLCCNNKFHRDAKVNGKKCCLPGTESYYLHNETCCYSTVKDKTEECTGSNNRKPSSIMQGQSGPKGPAQPEQQTKGVCRVCSPGWRPNAIIMSIYSKDTNICTQKAMKFVVNKVHQLNTIGLPLAMPWTWLNVTSKHNIYREKGAPSLKQNFTLFLPCACPELKKMEGEKILLLTNAEFNKKRIFLGDSDLILPGRRKVLQLVKKQSKTCPNYVVQNIAFLIQMSSIG
ncbi:uncharacterized protein LOC134283475 [Saccostrea cucullata]|uniref:uncharacterized protein LOC134283475 n=1 Tax=Saccostrea cuccullata TaxID=36930 RepID=UPI002ED0CC3E